MSNVFLIIDDDEQRYNNNCESLNLHSGIVTYLKNLQGQEFSKLTKDFNYIFVHRSSDQFPLLSEEVDPKKLYSFSNGSLTDISQQTIKATEFYENLPIFLGNYENSNEFDFNIFKGELKNKNRILNILDKVSIELAQYSNGEILSYEVMSTKDFFKELNEDEKEKLREIFEMSKSELYGILKGGF